MLLSDGFRQVQVNKLHDESYYAGVSITFIGKTEDKELVCKTHKHPAGHGLISLMLQMPRFQTAPCSCGLSQSKYPELGPREGLEDLLRM